jgi:predicted MFS family arabinose efflux permease
MAVFALTGLESLPVSFAAVLVAGLATPPLEGGLRALWARVLPKEGQLHTAYAMDAVAQEVLFTVGPLLITLGVSLWSAPVALLLVNGVGVLGALSVVVSEPSRSWRSAPREAHWLGALRSPGLRVLLGSFFFVGMALGSLSVAASGYADDHGRQAVYGWLMAANGLGALVGGVVYGARQWSGTPEGRLRLLAGLLAVCYLPPVLVPGVPLMLVLVLLSGVFLAPALACVFVVIDLHAPRGTVTEAFSWLVTAVGVGAAGGTAAGGPLLELGGTAAGFAVGSAGALAGALVLLTTRRFLTAGGREEGPGAGAEHPAGVVGER